MKVEIYSDVVCPWCYIGKMRFERALADFPGRDAVEVVYRPYQLDPNAPKVSQPLRDYLGRRFGANAVGMQGAVGRAATSEGITIDWERAIAANTFDAHRLLQRALREHGSAVQRDLVGRLFDAHFSRGIDVGDTVQLVALASAAGMDAEATRAFLASGEGVAELRQELAAARGLGVQAVPTFVFDEQYVVEGGQPTPVFARVLSELRAAHEVEAPAQSAAKGSPNQAVGAGPSAA